MPQEDSNIMASEAEKIVADFCKAFESKNLEAIMGFFTEDAIYHNIPMKPVTGKAAIRTTIQSFMPKSASDTITFKILHTGSNGNVVFNERVDAFDTGGKHVELPVAGVFEISGGKIAKWRDYFDLQSFTKQMA
jgi:limonene-1,2-epoxide hydrolase